MNKHFDETRENIMVVDNPLDEMDVPELPVAALNLRDAAMNEKINLETMISTKESSKALLNANEAEEMQKRWNVIQQSFVDEPRISLQQADALVSKAIEKITKSIANELSMLEGQWNRGEDISTEDLRVALQHYRTFFKRLMI